ncbi:helix-turn-helix domain-containing protein [Methylomonas sp. UP202]|uniref:helix-turn-helix domain-containing protein n=1 Tax=Methylomonas sp. UP202 TaxID=3040943 RepID=UPI0024790AF6|nr:helix-turn-helix domain-containing protein [Methylomonas sp. UP202]WGS85010.1 helix-turn-helix domain-containing protein [Methylomonas sp. UP202]
MSIAATRWAWSQALKPAAKLVLLCLADRANEDAECWPSIPRLVADVGADRKTVLAAIKWLESNALIRVARAPGGGNRYCLLFDQKPIQPSTKNGTSTDFGTSAENGTTPVPETGLPSPKYGTGTSTVFGTLNLKDESINNLPMNLPNTPDENEAKKSRTKSETEKHFEIAWSHYPSRSGGNPKTKAQKAFAARLKAGIDPQEIVAGTIRYAAWADATGKTGTEFVKQAATFFGPDLHFREPFTIPTNPAQPGGRKHAQKPKSADIRSQLFPTPAVVDSPDGSGPGASNHPLFAVGSDLPKLVD